MTTAANSSDKITTLLFDFSKVLLFANDQDYNDDLNPLHRKLLADNMNYDFLKYFHLNYELLIFLKTSKLKSYIFTSGQIQKAPAIQDDLHRVIEEVFSAEDLGLSKQDPKSYKIICEKINTKPKQILFIDDALKNIRPAHITGLNTFHFSNNAELIKHIKKL